MGTTPCSLAPSATRGSPPASSNPLKDKGPKDIDYCVVRENSGGLYTGMGGISRADSTDAVATQVMTYTYAQVERCCRFAFEYARKYGKKARGVGEKNTLALVGKSNVLTYMYQLWNRVFAEVGADYPDVERQYFHVDATTLYMVASPEMFDVIVTENMFGDIITDLAPAATSTPTASPCSSPSAAPPPCGPASTPSTPSPPSAPAP